MKTENVPGNTRDVQGISTTQCNRFSRNVLEWFEHHGRKDLPWQQDVTPYRVWVSEIMLQQTQVTTVIPYFQRFMQRFADVQSLAAATQDQVLELWTGLGYYARGRNLHRAAQLVVQAHGGKMPDTIEQLESLPGIGKSTAGAIVSLGYGRYAAILDGNVKRVLCRYRCIDGWPGTTTVERRLWELSDALTPSENTAHYNQAMMDLGATLCTRSRPGCLHCPVAGDCLAARTDTPTDWPSKKPKKIKPVKTALMLLLVSDKGVLLQRRPPSGIWGGLWSFPQFEQIEALHRFAADIGSYDQSQIEQWAVVKHSFTHFDLQILPVRIALKVAAEQRIMEAPQSCWVLSDPPGGCAAPVKRLLEKLNCSLI